MSYASCDKEPIHMLNRIQTCGYAIVINENCVIQQVSENWNRYKDLIGKHLQDLLSKDDVMKVKANMQMYFKRICNSETLIHLKGTHSFTIEEEEYIGTLIGSNNNNFILEFEKNKFESDLDILTSIGECATVFKNCTSVVQVAQRVCDIVMNFLPYDRAMVYRFADDYSGEVIHESFRQHDRKNPHHRSFRGLRFPASDIPQVVRKLYMKNMIRFIHDSEDEGVPLYPEELGSGEISENPNLSKHSDLSLARMRVCAPMHRVYLQNMGTKSTLSIRILVDDKLWGLYSFHNHSTPVFPNLNCRSMCEILSNMSTVLIENLIHAAETKRFLDTNKVLGLLQNMSVVSFFNEKHTQLLDLLEVQSISIKMYHRPYVGYYGKEDIISKNIIDSLRQSFQGEVFFTDNLTHLNDLRDSGNDNTKDLTHSDIQAIDDTGAAYFEHLGTSIAFFRTSVCRTISWAGNPNEKLSKDMCPKRSFDVYVAEHRMKSKEWTKYDRSLIKLVYEKIVRRISMEALHESEKVVYDLHSTKMSLLERSKNNYDFFAHMAHELRTPFHGVFASLEALEEDWDGGESNYALLRTAMKCAESMTRILDDILLIAKGHYGLTTQRKPFDCKECVQNVVDMMRNFGSSRAISVLLKYNSTDKFRILIGDMHRLRQVLNNLLSNAIKFSHENGTVELCMQKFVHFFEVREYCRKLSHQYVQCQPDMSSLATFDTPEHIWFVFSVYDNGIGINKEQLENLGKAFFQVSDGQAKQYQGTGLGLYICNLLTKALGGFIIMLSTPFKGSCFIATIPFEIATDKVTQTILQNKQDIESAQKRYLHKKQAQNERHKNNLDIETPLIETEGIIIIADDITINLKLCARKIMRIEPHVKIISVKTGRDALNNYIKFHREVRGLFLDYHMPDMDGEEATIEIRKFELKHEIAPVMIVGLTADVVEKHTQNLLESGMNAVIGKPEPKGEMENMVLQMMEKKANSKLRHT